MKRLLTTFGIACIVFVTSTHRLQGDPRCELENPPPGTPHVVFAGVWSKGGLSHAIRGDTSWTIDTVEEEFNSYDKMVRVPHLALDSHQNLYMVYSLNRRLVFRESNSCSSKKKILDSYHMGREAPAISLALDTEERPVVAYYSQDQGKLILAMRPSRHEDWEYETIEDTTERVGGVEIAFDERNVLHVVYKRAALKNQCDRAEEEIVYARREAEKWTFETVHRFKEDFPGTDMSIIFDRNGSPNVAWTEITGRMSRIGFARRINTNEWELKPIHTVFNGVDIADGVSLARDSQGDLHAAFSMIINYSPFLYYSRLIEDSWSDGQLLDASYRSPVALYPKLALLGDDTPVILSKYEVGWPQSMQLRYYVRTAEGTWTHEEVNPGMEGNGLSSYYDLVIRNK